MPKDSFDMRAGVKVGRQPRDAKMDDAGPPSTRMLNPKRGLGPTTRQRRDADDADSAYWTRRALSDLERRKPATRRPARVRPRSR